MVEAVAMRTWGLGGDSAVHVTEGLDGDLYLGPHRVLPISLLAHQHPALVHAALDVAMASQGPATDGGGFVVPLWSAPPQGLDPRESALAQRLSKGPLRMGEVVQTRMDSPALQRLVTRGLVQVAGVTPSDAAHVTGLATQWDTEAARKALTLMARRKRGDGQRIAPDAETLACRIVDQLTHQTADCLLQAAFADDTGWDASPEALARHQLTRAGLDRHAGLIETTLRLGLPVIGLGASAASYYGAVGDRLGTRMVVPEHAAIANAIGAVVGQVAHHATGTLTAPMPGQIVSHGPDGPTMHDTEAAALDALTDALTAQARALAQASGVVDPRITVITDVQRAEIEGQSTFVGATLRATATGRPRIARDTA